MVVQNAHAHSTFAHAHQHHAHAYGIRHYGIMAYEHAKGRRKIKIRTLTY
jgi:hypothetical protein